MATSDDSAFHKLDDTDPSITYTGEWFDNPGISNVFNNTLSSTTHPGDTAHIEFTASQIVVIGATVAPGYAPANSGPISGYTLDGATNSVFLFQASLANATSVVFYNSGPLTFGKHTLDISVVQTKDNIPYLLDTIFLQEPQATQSASASSTGVWISTVFVTPSAAPTSAADQGKVSGNASTSSVPVGAIVGGVVGGVALLVSAALAFYFLFYRPRHRSYAYRSFGDAPPLFASGDKDDFDGKPSTAQAPQLDPYLAAAPTVGYADAPPYTPSAPSEVPSTPVSSHSYPPAPASASGSGVGSNSGRTLSVVNDASAGAFLTPAQRKAAEARRSKAEAEAVQYHADSGVRFDEQGRPIEASASTSEPPPLADVPPEYTPS